MAEQSNLLTLLKLDLIIATNAYDSLLTQLIESAKLMITREGATLPDSESAYTAEDIQLVVGCAAYLFRRRTESDADFPRWLRWALNNRIFCEKMQAGGDGNG